MTTEWTGDEFLDTPSDADVIDRSIRNFEEELHTALPGRIVSYDAIKKTANIQVLQKRAIEQRDGSFKAEPFPILPNVPVHQPAGGGYFVHFPLVKGDFVWVFFSERSIDRVRTYDRVDMPDDQRKHDLSHGFAMPMYDLVNAKRPTEHVDGKLVIGKLSGGPVMAIDGTAVNLGDAAAASPVARSDKTDDELGKMKDDLDAILTALSSLAGAAPSGGGPVDFSTWVATLPTAHTPASVAATKAKAT